MDPEFSYTCKKSTIINIALVILYSSSLLWSLVISFIWISHETDVYYQFYDEEGIYQYYSVHLFGYPFAMVIMVLIELLFAIIAFIIHCRCDNKCSRIAFKIFMWLSAIMSAGTIIDIALGIAATKATECTIFLEFTEDLKEEIIDACFKPHSNISALLPFYILSHVFILLHLLTSNYGFPKEDVLSDTMNDNNEPIYVQAPAPVPPPQPANYNKFY